jgi:hypothetical protein
MRDYRLSTKMLGVSAVNSLSWADHKLDLCQTARWKVVNGRHTKCADDRGTEAILDLMPCFPGLCDRGHGSLASGVQQLRNADGFSSP